MSIKYYESKMNLNWKPILKSIIEVFPLLLSHNQPMHLLSWKTSSVSVLVLRKVLS